MTQQNDFQERCSRNVEEANLLSDFATWQYKRKQKNLLATHDEWVSHKQYNESESRRLNDEAKQRRRARVEAELRADKAQTQQTVELELAADKKRLQNQWLVNNPTQTPADFEKKAWHLLKENLVAERSDAQMEAEMRSARAEMDYF
jgi:hypothetical protein